MKMNSLLLIPVLVSALLFSCKECPPTPESGGNTIVDADNQVWDMLTTDEFDSLANWDEKDKNYGTIVPYSLVKPCLKLYEITMVDHRIVVDPKNPPAIVDDSKYLQITLSESFRGKELRKFLRQAAARRALLPSNKKLEIKMAIGIYTKELAARLNPEREGRIGIFLITKRYKEDAGGQWRDDEEEDEDSFNFGGIHP